jgi:hypothetical protein
MSEFKLDFIQAVNDWQRGGNTQQKQKRGARLKELSREVDKRFRFCNHSCYRQIALEKRSVWDLFVKSTLDETISAWTLDSAIAKNFKGGVPPKKQGYQGVIFTIKPKKSCVVINLKTLLDDESFKASISTMKNQVKRYEDGIGLYQGSQAEVVLELKSLDIANIYALGGFSSDKYEFLTQLLGYCPSQTELGLLDQLLKITGGKLGPAWIEGKAVDRVIMRMKPHVEKLRARKQCEDDPLNMLIQGTGSAVSGTGGKSFGGTRGSDGSGSRGGTGGSGAGA